MNEYGKRSHEDRYMRREMHHVGASAGRPGRGGEGGLTCGCTDRFLPGPLTYVMERVRSNRFVVTFHHTCVEEK